MKLNRVASRVSGLLFVLLAAVALPRVASAQEEAYLTLQRQSRQRRRPMKEVAEAIVLAEEVRRGQQEA